MILGQHTIKNVMFNDDVPRVLMCNKITIKKGKKILFSGKAEDIPEDLLNTFISVLSWKNSKSSAFKPFDYTIQI